VSDNFLTTGHTSHDFLKRRSEGRLFVEWDEALRGPLRYKAGIMNRKLLLLGCLALLATSCYEDVEYDCSVFPQAQLSEYILPWHSWHSYVANPHAARETTWKRYAVDVWMPIGTEILAMRDGFVIRVEESFTDYDNVPGHENYVFVEHSDRTVARYVHLTRDGAKVTVGDGVRKGDLIGYSGHTGNSTDPHLHIDLLSSCCAMTIGENQQTPGMTMPLSFQNARAIIQKGMSPPANCGLRKNVAYTALPY
jgi:murein DD-endopeptidase MepM/ murein hydrolase activator NlpD